MNLFVFGLGYSALALIAEHRERYGAIAGTVTTPGKAARLGAMHGIAAFPFDTDAAAPMPAGLRDALRQAEALLVSVPPDTAGDPLLPRFADSLREARHLRAVGYLSTVGVYGDRGGGWVDSATAPAPSEPRSVARLCAENAWRGFARAAGIAVSLYRIAGIYGAGRNALAQVKAGTARRIVKPGQVFNRIHVADIAAIVAAGLAREAPEAIYDLADDEPSPPQDVITHAAALLGVAPPPEIPFEQAALSPMAASFYGECKRVSNRHTKAALGLTLRYPTYREGLAALYAAGEGR